MQLNKTWRIATDENNVILQFHEMRERKKKGSDDVEPFEYVDQFYYPSIKTALNGFLNKSIKDAETAEVILKRISEVETIISNLKF